MVRLPALRDQKTLSSSVAMGNRPPSKHLVEPFGTSDDGVRRIELPRTAWEELLGKIDTNDSVR
jgi:hypothetical protein